MRWETEEVECKEMEEAKQFAESSRRCRTVASFPLSPRASRKAPGQRSQESPPAVQFEITVSIRGGWRCVKFQPESNASSSSKLENCTVHVSALDFGKHSEVGEMLTPLLQITIFPNEIILRAARDSRRIVNARRERFIIRDGNSRWRTVRIEMRPPPRITLARYSLSNSPSPSSRVSFRHDSLKLHPQFHTKLIANYRGDLKFR